MRPDFKHTATGYVWLDKLTFPFWMLYDKWAEWRFFRYVGRGDAERGREILRRAVEIDGRLIEVEWCTIHGAGHADGTATCYLEGLDGSDVCRLVPGDLILRRAE